MKWLLITTMLNSPMVYKEEKTCIAAMNSIIEMTDNTAVCIPQGEDKSEESFKRFQKMLNSFSQGMKSE